MKKLTKNTKMAFTLVEIVIVIAIICVLSVCLFLSVGDYIKKAKSATASVEEHNSQIQAATSEIDNGVSQ